MALSIDQCLIPQGRGANQMHPNCCCTFSCVVTNLDDSTFVNDIQTGFLNSQFSISDFHVDGTTPSFPFLFDKGTSITIDFVVCAASLVNVSDELYIKFYDNSGSLATFNFDFITIDVSAIVNITSIDFSNVPVGSSASFPVEIYNPTACCYEYFITSGCNEEITFDTSQTSLLCTDAFETINVIYTPTTVDSFSCEIRIEAGMCILLDIPVTANSIAPETSSSSNGQKNKVDQTSVLPACSPRTINNQCNTGATARAAITSRAQTITRSSGGAGRGKGFSK